MRPAGRPRSENGFRPTHDPARDAAADPTGSEVFAAMEPYAVVAEAPRVIVHSPAHVRAALCAAAAAGRPVTLVSAADAARYQGPGWLLRVARRAAESVPSARWTLVLDAGDAPGFALAALENGVPAVAVKGLPAEVVSRLQAMAEALGAAVMERPSDALDLLGHADPEGACRTLMAGAGRGI